MLQYLNYVLTIDMDPELYPGHLKEHKHRQLYLKSK